MALLERKCMNLTNVEIIAVLLSVLDLLKKEPSLVHVNPPAKVIGDLHGQFNDLLHIISQMGYPGPSQRFVFLGDYVDRGENSIEVMIYICCLKIVFPEHVVILRGNHESEISAHYGFKDECTKKYSENLWLHFNMLFNFLPAACTIGLPKEHPKIFCLHGGISPHMKSINEILAIKKPYKIPDLGLLCDLFWSDPSPKKGWNFNSERGISCTFGEDVLEKFKKDNHLDLICRAHEWKAKGYEFFANRGLITIFSAKNYSGVQKNPGTVLEVDAELGCSLFTF